MLVPSPLRSQVAQAQQQEVPMEKDKQAATEAEKPQRFDTGGNISFRATAERVEPVYTEETQAPAPQHGPRPERIISTLEAEQAAERRALERKRQQAELYPKREPKRHKN